MNYHLPNVIHLTPRLAVGGQPTASQLVDAKAMGLKQIINLRPASEDAGFDEAVTVSDMGIGYHCLPINGRADLTLENVRRFDALLTSAGDTSVLIHCASGNRVGALFALRAAWLHGQDVDAALQIGKQHGLTSMLDAVKEMLSANTVSRSMGLASQP